MLILERFGKRRSLCRGTRGDHPVVAACTDTLRTFTREFLLFGVKQASACIFGGYLLALILLTRWWYPEWMPLYRNDALFVAAVLFQLALLLGRFETPREALVIVIFHVVATGMEVFKTSDAIGSWHYPGESVLRVGNVPLFAGFMYSAVGSYIARIWRIFDFRFSHYPPQWSTVVLVALVYLNFFTHHYVIDIRYGLLLLTALLFGRCQVYFRVDRRHRHMPLLLGWLLTAAFIWLAENISTWAGIWLYPTQGASWHLVPLSKLIAWFLLMLLSFVLVSLVHRPRAQPGTVAADS